MNALIILAHGSRRHESNQEVINLTNEVRKKANDNFQFVEHAFLELTEPQLLFVIENVISQGATKITVFPYFLNSGNHVKQDIPEIIDAAIEKHPGCKFIITPHIGMLKDMPELILEQTKL